MKLEGLYDGTWFLHNKKPIIILFGRNKNREKYIYIEENFRPYFVVLEEEAKQKQIFNNFKIEKIEKEDVMSGRRDLVKIVYENPSQTYELRQKFNKHWEADILFVNRYVIDKVEQDHGDNKFFYFDIETTSTYGFPDYQNPIEQIISISLYNSHTNQYILWIWHPNYKKQTYQTKNEKVEYEVRRFGNEKGMLMDFFQYIVDEKPDYMLAWNVLFDWNYTIARLKVLGFNIEMLSPIYKLKIERKWKIQLAKFMYESAVSGKMRIGGRDEGYWKIVGLEFFDLLQGFRNTYGKELTSYSLDSVADEVLGERKLETHFDIEKKWKEDPSFIEKYNIIDTYLIVKITEKMGIMKRFMGFKILSNLLILRDAFASGRILDNFILTKFKDKYVFPSKRQIKWDKWNWGNHVTGGFVFYKKPGIFKNAIEFDFSGMYPNIIKTFNLGAESLEDYEFVWVDNSKDEVFEIPQLPEKFDGWIHLNTQKVKGKVKINFSKKAVITQILDEMIAARKKVKKERDQYEPGTPEYEALDTLQFSYKFVINSVGPDTLVPVRKKGTNKLIWMKIKDLESCWQEYETLVNVPNTDKFEWCEIRGFIKEKPSDRKIVEIKTKYNYTIQLSTNHSIYVLENGKEVMKKGDELKVGDKVVMFDKKFTKKKFIEIKDIKIKDYDGYLYDLTVPPYYDFIGGEIGVFRLRDSSYGVNAYPGFRLFSPIIANTITTLGRMLIKWVSRNVEERFGWSVIFIDTDGVTFQPDEEIMRLDMSKEEDRKKIEKKIKEVEEYINGVLLPQFLEKQLPSEKVKESSLKVDFAMLFDKLIYVTKKRYIGRMVNKEGKWGDKLVYMGLDAKRANNPQIVKEAQLEVAKAILYNRDWKEVVDKYYNIFNTANKEELIELLKLPTKLEKPIEEYKSKTPTIRGVLWSNRYLKTNFRAGNKFYGIYVIPNRAINTDFICFENLEQLKNSWCWDNIQIDFEKYIDMLYTKLSFILEPAGLNEYNEKKKNELLNKIRWQSGLGRWL